MPSKSAKKIARKRQARAKALRTGRPRNEKALRTPSGAISRSKKEVERKEYANSKEAREIAVNARQKHYGAENDKAAVDPRYGYALGRFHLAGAINDAQHKAGLRFSEEMASYYGLTGIPFPCPRAQNLFAVSGFEGETTEGRARAARAASNRIMAAEGCLLRCGEFGRNIHSTIKSVCVEDLGEIDWPPNMKAWLRVGLNALAELYGYKHVDERKHKNDEA